MYSVGILSIACLGVISVLTFGMLTGDAAGNFSTATQLGREIIEIIRTDRINIPIFPVSSIPAGLTDTALSTTPRKAINAPPLDNPVYGLPSDGRFTRNIQITPVTANRFNRVQVRIYWIQNGTEKMVETVAFQRSGL